jgi:ribose-phosphate pyrophosphokinase
MLTIDLDAPETYDTIQFLTFSGGEEHVKIPVYDTDPHILVKSRINDQESLMRFLTLLNALAAQNIKYKNIGELTLYVPYFPGSRQDRSDGQSPLTCELTAALIAGALCSYTGTLRIYTFDLHSTTGKDIVLDVFDGLYGYPSQQVPWITNIGVDKLNPGFFDADIVNIVIPDKGAVDRATLFRDTFFPHAHLVQCEKIREFNTGKIRYYELANDNYFIKGKSLVVDDICDGGGTFNLLAQVFQGYAPEGSELQLYVSHGIFSKTPEALDDIYSKIYTTDSFFHPYYDLDYPNVIEMPVPELEFATH